MSKIAILTDTGCGLERERFGKSTYVVPLYINFKERSYKDMEEISAEEVYKKMQTEIPKTSTASIDDIKKIINKIKRDGYTDILCISISSKLSGIFNAMNLAARDVDGINFKALDTKNISFGTGFFVLYAQTLLDKVSSLQELYDKLESNIKNSKVFFSIDTLKYLIEGGRIGRVLGGIGSMLRITPIMSCDEDGVYYTVAKKRSLEKAILEIADQTKAFVDEHKTAQNRYFAIIYKNDENILNQIREALKDEFATASYFLIYNVVSPALGVHTGPGLVGVGAFCF